MTVVELVINSNFLFWGHHEAEHLYDCRCAGDIDWTIWNLWMISIVQNRPDEPAKFYVKAIDWEKTEKKFEPVAFDLIMTRRATAACCAQKKTSPCRLQALAECKVV